MIRFASVLCAVNVLALFACSGPQGHEQESGVDSVVDHFVSEGLTCRTQGEILALSETEQENFRTSVEGFLPAEESWQRYENPAKGCGTNAVSGEIGSASQAITGTYLVESIEETTVSGSQPNSIFRDSSSSSWMCNSGSPESPADWVVQYHVNGAYADFWRIAVKGNNFYGSCYIPGALAARVYSDSDIRACVGYWTVFACGAVTPLAADTRMGLL